MTKEECRVCLREPREKTSCDCGSKNKNQEKKKGFGLLLTKLVWELVPKPIQELVSGWVITWNLFPDRFKPFPNFGNRFLDQCQ